MVASPFDGTIWDNTSLWNTLVSQNGMNTNFYGHGTYVSASCGGVTVGYAYHLPPTWYSEPNRKFPVVYVPSGGGGTDETWIAGGGPGFPDPLQDANYTSAQGNSFNLNWGENAKCVLIMLNGCLSGPTVHFDPPVGAPMNGVMMMESQQHEVLDFMESPNHPVFATGGVSRLCPQGQNDPNGGKFRAIMGHSGGTHHSIYHVAKHPERYSSCFLLAISGGSGAPATYLLQACNNDANFDTSIREPNGDTGAFGVTFTNNVTNIKNAGIWWHVQVSTPEGINETVSDGFSNTLIANGFNVTPEVKIPFNWHTPWCYTGTGGPQPLPWAVSHFKLNPTCNGPSGLSTPKNTALNVPSATVVANDTDPQLLTLQVASVSSPTNGTVSLTGGLGGTVNFTPTNNFVGTATFSYTAQNTDGQVGSGTASINVAGAAGTGNALTDNLGAALIDNAGNALIDSAATTTPTTTTLASSANPSTFGQAVTFTATVTPSGATGSVTFMDGVATLGTGNLNVSGQATFNTSSLAGGSHSITAVYGGDSNFAGSTSSVLTQTVNAVATTTTVASSLNPSTFGQAVTFTATVAQSGATGTVTFKDGTATIGTGTLSAGHATFNTSSLLGGSHSITAVYAGDGNFASSTSAPLTQTVSQATTTGLTSSRNPSIFTQPVTFTATVTPQGGSIVPTGTVTFRDTATTIGTGTLDGTGKATLATSALVVGPHNITASYPGDTKNAGSLSAVVTQLVNPMPADTPPQNIKAVGYFQSGDSWYLTR